MKVKIKNTQLEFRTGIIRNGITLIITYPVYRGIWYHNFALELQFLMFAAGVEFIYNR